MEWRRAAAGVVTHLCQEVVAHAQGVCNDGPLPWRDAAHQCCLKRALEQVGMLTPRHSTSMRALPHTILAQCLIGDIMYYILSVG